MMLGNLKQSNCSLTFLVNDVERTSPNSKQLNENNQASFPSKVAPRWVTWKQLNWRRLGPLVGKLYETIKIVWENKRVHNPKTETGENQTRGIDAHCHHNRGQPHRDGHQDCGTHCRSWDEQDP